MPRTSGYPHCEAASTLGDSWSSWAAAVCGTCTCTDSIGAAVRPGSMPAARTHRRHRPDRATTPPAARDHPGGGRRGTRTWGRRTAGRIRRRRGAHAPPRAGPARATSVRSLPAVPARRCCFPPMPIRHRGKAAAEFLRDDDVRVAVVPNRSIVQTLSAVAVHDDDRQLRRRRGDHGGRPAQPATAG